MRGTWQLENGLVAFYPYAGKRRYTHSLQSIEEAIETVKRNKDCYLTNEAYSGYLRHFEEGRGLLLGQRTQPCGSVDDMCDNLYN